MNDEQLKYFKIVNFVNEQTTLIEDGEDDFQKLYFELTKFILELDN